MKIHKTYPCISIYLLISFAILISRKQMLLPHYSQFTIEHKIKKSNYLISHSSFINSIFPNSPPTFPNTSQLFPFPDFSTINLCVFFTQKLQTKPTLRSNLLQQRSVDNCIINLIHSPKRFCK